MASSTRAKFPNETRHASGGDTPSAKRVILNAAQSSDGIIRLTTQNGTLSEQAALTKLTGSSDVLGAQAAAILTAAGVASLTGASTWGNAVTQIALS